MHLYCYPLFKRSRDVLVIGSAINNSLYRLIFFHIGYQISLCIKSSADQMLVGSY